jgi:hypothetical protein
MRRLRVEIAVVALLLAPFVGYGIGYFCAPKSADATRPAAAQAANAALPAASRIVGGRGT